MTERENGAWKGRRVQRGGRRSAGDARTLPLVLSSDRAGGRVSKDGSQPPDAVPRYAAGAATRDEGQMGAEGRPPDRGPGQARREGKNGAGEGAGQARSYDRTGHSICIYDMQNMTSHDTSQEVLLARMTKHDIP